MLDSLTSERIIVEKDAGVVICRKWYFGEQDEEQGESFSTTVPLEVAPLSGSRAHCPSCSNLLISFLRNLRCAQSSHKSPQAVPLPSPRPIYYRIRQCLASRNLLLGRLPLTSRSSESWATAGGAIAIALKGLTIPTTGSLQHAQPTIIYILSSTSPYCLPTLCSIILRISAA